MTTTFDNNQPKALIYIIGFLCSCFEPLSFCFPLLWLKIVLEKFDCTELKDAVGAFRAACDSLSSNMPTRKNLARDCVVHDSTT